LVVTEVHDREQYEGGCHVERGVALNSAELLITDDDAVRELLLRSRRIAVLGIKPETHAMRPAHYVPSYLADVGYDVIPVPVYYPDVRQILGKPVYRTLSAVPGAIDVVDVFRRAEHVMAHIPDILAKRPHAVWLQSGIRHDEAARQLTEAGIMVVQDRCMLADHQRLRVGRPAEDLPG
jgi:uncharacterized protein